MVFIPPAVMLIAIVAIDFLFGPVAMIFAAPLTVVLFALVKELYKNAGLGVPASVARRLKREGFAAERVNRD